jgi:hypothetical protein
MKINIYFSEITLRLILNNNLQLILEGSFIKRDELPALEKAKPRDTARAAPANGRRPAAGARSMIVPRQPFRKVLP